MHRSLNTFIAAALAAILLVGAAEGPRADRVADAIRANGFTGQVLAAKGDTILYDRATDGLPQQAVWPWASVTKQVIATMVMQQVAAGKIALDTPASRYMPMLSGSAAGPTVRELLQHRSGLRNPDDTPAPKDGMPAFYTARYAPLGWCLAERGAPGGNWRYNNCDYVVLGALLTRVTGQSVGALYTARIARPAGSQARFVGIGDGLRLDWPGGVTPAERRIFARFGAAGGLAGTARDLLAFDRALAGGKLLPDTARAELWRGDSKLGFQALGQWSFEAPLKGCTGTVRIIERRGGIGRFQVRNIILPDQDVSVIVFTNRGDYDFGEIWQGKGFSYDLLSAAACA